MNKVLLLLISLCILFSACNNEVDNICTFQLVNNSSKLITMEVGVKSNQVLILTDLPGDSSNVIHYSYRSYSFEPIIYYKRVAFYNLSDTTSFIINDYYRQLRPIITGLIPDTVPTAQDSLLYRSWYFEEVSRNHDEIRFLWSVRMSDSLVDTFTKDKSMLDRFRKYYDGLTAITQSSK